QHQETGLPPDDPAEGRRGPHNGRSHQVIRERPEIAVLPDPRHVLSFGESDDDGNGPGVGDKVHGRDDAEHYRDLDLRQQLPDPAVDDVRGGYRKRTAPGVEDNLDNLALLPRVPEILPDHRRTSD